MALEQSYPLFALGPRTDLNWGYLNCVINGSTVTTDNSATSNGITIVRASAGVYTVTHPKCRFMTLIHSFKPVNAAGDRSVRVLAGNDPTVGTVTIEIAATLTGAAADPAAAANELDLVLLLGF